MTKRNNVGRFASLSAAVALMLACSGVSNPDIALPGDAGADSGGSSGKGGSDSGATSGKGGTENGGTENGGTAGEPEAGGGMGGSPLDPECEEGGLQCAGDVSQLCEGGMWVDQETCSDVCIGEGVCACEEDARQCSGNTPQLCEDGAWVNQAACGGATKVCTGEGACAAFRLLSGGIGTFGVRPAESGGYVLKEQSLSAAPRACNDDFCVTGGIQ